MNRIKKQVYAAQMVPGDLQTVPAGETLALIGGDLPYVTIWMGGRAYALHAGGCIPVNGPIEVENPFQRHGRVILGMNYPIAQAANDFPEEIHKAHNTFTAFGNYASVSMHKNGLAFMPKKARCKVKFYSPDKRLIITSYPHATKEFVDLKPAGMMPKTPALRHVSGVTFKDCYIFGGAYDDADIASWVAASGYAQTPVSIRYETTEWTGYVNPGEAIFCYVLQGFAADITLEVEDLGTYYGGEL